MKNNKKLYLAILSLLLLIGNASFAAKEKKYVLSSPDGTLKVEISAGNELAYQVMHGNDTILSHSNIGLVLENGTIVGKTSASRNVLMPLSALIPAPDNMTKFFIFRSFPLLK